MPGQKQKDLTIIAQAGGQLNPDWVEWLMGYPIGWTGLEPLEMDKYQQWLHSHGASSLMSGTKQNILTFNN